MMMMMMMIMMMIKGLISMCSRTFESFSVHVDSGGRQLNGIQTSFLGIINIINYNIDVTRRLGDVAPQSTAKSLSIFRMIQRAILSTYTVQSILFKPI